MSDSDDRVFLTDKEKEYLHSPLYDWLRKRNWVWDEAQVDGFIKEDESLKIYEMNVRPSTDLSPALKEINCQDRHNVGKENAKNFIYLNYYVVVPIGKQKELKVVKAAVKN